MGGYWGRSGCATEIGDSLYARAVVFQGGAPVLCAGQPGPNRGQCRNRSSDTRTDSGACGYIAGSCYDMRITYAFRSVDPWPTAVWES